MMNDDWEWQAPMRTLTRELEAAGYRAFGSPTKKALDEGLAVQIEGGRGESAGAVIWIPDQRFVVSRGRLGGLLKATRCRCAAVRSRGRGR